MTFANLGLGTGTYEAFTVAATEPCGLTDTATMTMEVYGAATEHVPTPEVQTYNLWHGLGIIEFGHRKGIEGTLLSGADRIDSIYSKGTSLLPVASQVFVQDVEVTIGAYGGPTAPALNNTWPSDHAAVLTTFQLQ